MKRRAFISALGSAAALALAFVGPVRAQDLMRNLDLTSPDVTSAEMTRAEVETALASHETDFTGKKTFRPRPIRAQPLGCPVPRRTPQQNQADRRKARWRHSQSGVAFGC